MIQLKQNDERNETELWINGEFQASWHQFDFDAISRQLDSIFDKVFEEGKKERSREISRLLS